MGRVGTVSKGRSSDQELYFACTIEVMRSKLLIESSPGSLILPITTLYDLMLSGQYFLLEDFRPSTLIDASHLENLSGIHKAIVSPSHNRNSSDHAFVNL